jgi:hypothetical protein
MNGLPAFLTTPVPPRAPVAVEEAPAPTAALGDAVGAAANEGVYTARPRRRRRKASEEGADMAPESVDLPAPE